MTPREMEDIVQMRSAGAVEAYASRNGLERRSAMKIWKQETPASRLVAERVGAPPPAATGGRRGARGQARPDQLFFQGRNPGPGERALIARLIGGDA